MAFLVVAAAVFWPEDLAVRGQVAFAGIGAWHEIGIRRVRLDTKDRYHLSGLGRIRLGIGQSFEPLAGRRHIFRIEKAEHVVERPVFQHQYHDMVVAAKELSLMAASQIATTADRLDRAK
jgi:hypothetical protein